VANQEFLEKRINLLQETALEQPLVSVHPAKRNCLILSLKTRKIGWTFFVIFVIGKTASN
jgi:hypothetical protein